MLFQSKYKFHNPVVGALNEPAFMFARDGGFLFCNATARDLLKTLNYDSSHPPEHISAFTSILKFIKGTGTSSVIRVAERQYQIVERAFEDGILLRLMPLHEDKHLERLSSSLNVMPWGLLTLDVTEKNPEIVFCNDKAEEFFGLKKGKLKGEKADDIFSREGFGDIGSFFRTPETSYQDLEIKKDDATKWYRFHFIPYANKAPYCLVVIEDTTERKVIENQYFQAQRLDALGKLAGGVAHDFNNILSIIDGYARMAKKTVAENENALNYVERIMQSVQRGAALTGKLLAFGRYKAVKDTVIDLGSLVQDQEPLLRPLIDASIELNIHAEEEIYINVAPDNICQILLNLCVNARDAMPDGGTLSIYVQNGKAEKAILCIKDTGTGMTQSVKARMFDPFFTTKDQGKGTGLGLSMVYGLVKEMNGEIDVVSQVGSGTSITISLPLSAKKSPLDDLVEDSKGEFSLDGLTALVAEDEPDLLALVSGMVEDMGINVLKACNGQEALMMQEDFKGNIDFLITDVVMPELNGVKLAELFQSLRPESKVMFMSGYPAQGQMNRVPLPEDSFFIPKPVDFKKLGDVLEVMANDPLNTKGRGKFLTGQWTLA